MTDQTPPRPVRANPGPRRALPRVTPLASVPDDDERVLWAATHAEGATGRDLLIPNGPTEPPPAKPADKPGRKGRGAVPSLSELMPPSSPRRKKGPGARPAASTDLPAEPVSAPDAELRPAKKGELVVTLPKPLRKRLKAKAAEHGMTPEQAVTELISVWVDG